jgi:hypothetical protein
MRRLIPGLAVLLLFAGCDRGVVGDSTVFGDYSLRTVNGASLPATAGNIQYLDDVISLAEAGTYIETGHIKNTDTGVTQPTREVGAYEFVFGVNLTLRSADGIRTRLVKVEDSEKITYVEAGVSLVWHK